MDLNEALNQFDATETTLRRLEAVWERLDSLVPADIVFLGDSPEGVEYEELSRAFQDLAGGLPAIDGLVVGEFPLNPDEIAHGRLEAKELGELGPMLQVEQAVAAPGEAIRAYRSRFNRARRQLVRDRVRTLVEEVDRLLAELVRRIKPTSDPVYDDRWVRLTEDIREIERLMGSAMSRNGRWPELSRHLGFGQGCDLHDIANHDWPSVLQDIQGALYGQFEPMPVNVQDLAELAASRPAGQASTKLAWENLDDEAFERLIFNLANDAPGYENAQWLMKTRAPDRGRDISVDRVSVDSLTGVLRERVIVQCRHSLQRSITPGDVAQLVAAVKLWEPPPVAVLIIATSGRFSADAVAWIEKHNGEQDKPRIEPWPESHLESLLARRPHLVSTFGLRA